jgi:hypothetical protein
VVSYIRPFVPNILRELETLLPKLLLMLKELRCKLEPVGFIGERIDGISELPELAPV